MKLPVLLLASLAVVSLLPVRAQQNLYQSRTCDRLGGSNVVVNLNEILRLRIPGLPVASFSSSCRQMASSLRDGWRQADETSVEQLDNRLCSYRMGWIEKVPGTCTAGGPPPICPAHHWIQVGPEHAMAAMASQESGVLHERETQLAKAACSCKLGEYQNTHVPKQAAYRPEDRPTTTHKPPPPPSESAGPVISCDSGCPMGMSCKENICRAPSAQEVNRRQLAENPIVESFTDQAMEKSVITTLKSPRAAAIEAIKLALEITEAFPVQVARTMYDVVAPTTLGTDKRLYADVAVETTRHLQEVKELDDELAAFKNKRPSRDPAAIAIQKRHLQELLREDIQHLNLAFLGVKDSKELTPFDCPDVMQFRQDRLNQAIVNVISTSL